MVSRNVPKYKNVLVFLIIYFSSNSFVLTVKYGSWSTQITVAVLMIAIYFSIRRGIYHISQNVYGLITILLINVLCTALLNGYTQGYLFFLIDCILVVAIIHLYSREEFIAAYVNAIFFLSIFAIATDILMVVFPSIMGSFRLYPISRTDAYYDLLFSFQNNTVIRINSVWGEPGMYAVYLIYALFFELMEMAGSTRKCVIVVLSIALFLTFSSTGYLCFAILIVAVGLGGGKDSSKNKYLSLGFVAVILYVILSQTDVFQSQFGAATEKFETDNISFIGRVAPVLYNLQEGFKAPLFGHGLTGGKFFVDFSFYTGYLACDTSTTTSLFKCFGITIPAITIYLSYLVAKIQNISVLSKMILFILIILNVNTQNVLFDQLYWLILFIPFMRTQNEFYDLTRR